MPTNQKLYKLDIKSVSVDIEDISDYIYLHFQNSDILFKWNEDYTEQLNMYINELAKNNIADEDIDVLRHEYITLIEDVVEDIDENVHASMCCGKCLNESSDSNNFDSLLSDMVNDLKQTITDNNSAQAWQAKYDEAPEGILGRIIGNKQGVELAKEKLLYTNIANRLAKDNSYQQKMGNCYSKYFRPSSLFSTSASEATIAKIEADIALQNKGFNAMMYYTDALQIKFNTDDIKSVTKIEFAGDIEEIDAGNLIYKDELSCGTIDYNRKLTPSNFDIKLRNTLINSIKNSEQVIEQISKLINDAYAETIPEMYKHKSKIARKMKQYKEDVNSNDYIEDALVELINNNLRSYMFEVLGLKEFIKYISEPCINEITEYLCEIDDSLDLDKLWAEPDCIDLFCVPINLVGKNIDEITAKLKNIIKKYHTKYLDLLTTKFDEMPAKITIIINSGILSKMINKALSQRYGGTSANWLNPGSDYNTDDKKIETDNKESAEVAKRLASQKIKIDISKSVHLLADKVIATYMDTQSLLARVEIKRGEL